MGAKEKGDEKGKAKRSGKTHPFPKSPSVTTVPLMSCRFAYDDLFMLPDPEGENPGTGGVGGVLGSERDMSVRDP